MICLPRISVTGALLSSEELLSNPERVLKRKSLLVSEQ